MIQFRIPETSIKSVQTLIQSKSNQLQLIVSPTSLTEIAKAVFTITGKKFIQDLSVAARQDPQRYHHLFEWGEVGNPSQKLFVMRRAKVQYGQLEIEILPLKSRKVVPIPARLLEPGPTGKVVSAQHIFRDKMDIMENDKPVHIYTRRTIVFSPDGQELVFVPKGRVIYIMHPGGSKTTHALKQYTQTWYRMKAPTAIIQSRLIRQIANEVVKTVNTQGSTTSMVYTAIRNVNSSYSKEVTTI